MMEPERIQKVLAKLGHGSRRQIEAMLVEGKIKVNGKRADLGCKITEKDIVEINQEKVSLKNLTQIDSNVQVLILNKPVGYLCSNKQGGFTRTKEVKAERPLVFELLPSLPNNQGRWVQIGRLDLNTSGLLLFTNHGELANKLMHPSSNINRVYQCRVYGTLGPKQFQMLQKGIKIDNSGRLAKFESIKSLTSGAKNNQKLDARNSWWQVEISEGRNREVRKIFEAVDLKVNRLNRVQYGSISLPDDLAEGRWVKLRSGEVIELMNSFHL